MRFFSGILFLLCFCFLAKAQESHGPGLRDQAYGLLGENPKQAVKIGEHLLKTADSEADIADANFLIAQSYRAQGKCNQALVYGFRAKEKAQSCGLVAQQIDIALFLSEILRNLQLDTQASQLLKSAQALADAQASGAIKTRTYAKATLETGCDALDRGNPKKALPLLGKADKALAGLSGNERAHLLAKLHICKGKAFSMLMQYDSAAVCFKRAGNYLRQQKNKNFLDGALLLRETAQLEFQQQHYPKAIGLLLEASQMAQKIQHPDLLKDIYKQLAINYLALDNRQKYHDYNQKFLTLSSDLETRESDATNTAFNLISKDQELRLSESGKKFAALLYAALACFVLVLLFGILQLARNRMRQKRYREIINYLESAKNAAIGDKAESAAKKEPAKNLVISTETEQNILARLKKFEASGKFTQREMSLAMLAAQLDTNTKYLSEIINKQYQDNFNTYINKLRIGYIIEKMKTEPAYLNYKISYLAEESGFSSHSSFATVFKSITGIAPTTFIEFLKEEATHKSDVKP